MPEPLRLLLIEDQAADADLMIAELARAGLSAEWERVSDEAGLRRVLKSAPLPDLVLSDYNLPQFDGLRALAILVEHNPDIPFILVSGTIGEEIAADAIKRGATDYLIKDRLGRLAPAVRQALEAKRLRAEKRQAEQARRQVEARLRALVEQIPAVTYIASLGNNPRTIFISPQIKDLLGYTPEEWLADEQLWVRHIHPEERQQVIVELDRRNAQGGGPPIDYRCWHRDGREIWIRNDATVIADDAGLPQYAQGIMIDITERVQHERELAALATLSAAMRTAATRTEAISTLLQQTLDLIGAEGTLIEMRDRQKRDSVVESGCGRWAALVGTRFDASTGPSAAIYASGNSYVNNSIDLDPHWSWPELAAGLKAMVGLPLIAREQLIGSLWIGRLTDFSDGDVRLLAAIADLAANAIYRATLHEQTERHAKQLAAVNTLGHALAQTLDLPQIYERMHEATKELWPDLAGLFISLYDTRAQTIACVYATTDGQSVDPATIPVVPLAPPGQGTQSQVIYTRRPLNVGNLQEQLKNSRHRYEVGDGKRTPQSALYAPMLTQDRVIGVIQVQSYVLERFTWTDVELLSFIANTAAVAIENAHLVNSLQDSNVELILAYETTLEGWSRALDLRDRETEGHTRRVTELTVYMATRLGLGEPALTYIRRGALLHDIGKMGIPDSILQKRGSLTEEEMEMMRLHPTYAYNLLWPIKFLHTSLDIPYCHHEKWDGAGYPRGLQGEEIPLAARIFAVVDVWDALTSDRRYSPAWPKEKALDYIREQSGRHFDPQMVKLFLELQPQWEAEWGKRRAATGAG